MAYYSFTTKLSLDTPVDKVWSVLLDFSDWPSWWKGVHDLSVDKKGQYPVVTVKLGYALYALRLRLTNEHYVLHKKITFTSSGDLAGTGVFHLTEKDKKTSLTFDWDVRTTQPWMNFLSPIARPFFGYSHNHVMQWFAEGLAQKLGAKLLTHEYITN